MGNDGVLTITSINCTAQMSENADSPNATYVDFPNASD